MLMSNFRLVFVSGRVDIVSDPGARGVCGSTRKIRVQSFRLRYAFISGLADSCARLYWDSRNEWSTIYEDVHLVSIAHYMRRAALLSVLIDGQHAFALDYLQSSPTVLPDAMTGSKLV